MQDLLNTLESAAKSLVDALESGVTTFTGQAEESQVRPSVTIYASAGEELPISSGNFRVTLSVALRSNASDTTIGSHRDKARTILAAFMDDQTAENLTAQASEFYVFAPIVNRRAREDKEDGCWLSELSMDCLCCLTALGAA